jgi:uroporphyrinogen decarboxylase
MNASPRDRVKASLQHRVPETIPAYVNNLVDSDRYLGYFAVADRGELLERLGNCMTNYTPKLRTVDENAPAGSSELSMWGVAKDMYMTYTDSVPRPLAAAETVADVDRFAWPHGDDWDFQDLRRRLESDQSHARLSNRWEPVFSRLCEMFGMEQAMVNLYMNRPVIEAALDHLEEYYDSYYRNLLACCGDVLDVFGLGDDFACNTGLLIPTDLWRRLFRPLYAKWLGMAKARGLPTLMHSCGRIVEILPDLMDDGLDAWETVQTHLPDQDASRLKRDFGDHLTFVGGIDTTNILGLGSVDDVKAHVERQIRTLGRNGGYICAPDHTIMAEVSPENTDALYRTCSAFRGEGYTTAR